MCLLGRLDAMQDERQLASQAMDWLRKRKGGNDLSRFGHVISLRAGRTRWRKGWISILRRSSLSSLLRCASLLLKMLGAERALMTTSSASQFVQPTELGVRTWMQQAVLYALEHVRQPRRSPTTRWHIRAQSFLTSQPTISAAEFRPMKRNFSEACVAETLIGV